MFVTQISVFVENKFGRLAEIIEVLGNEGIDISALSIADTTEFGILRLIVNRPEDAQKALAAHGVITKVTEVLAVSIDDAPGGLSAKLNLLKNAGISIEYMYAFIGKLTGKALMVLRVDRPADAEKVLGADTVVPAEEVYRL